MPDLHNDNSMPYSGLSLVWITNFEQKIKNTSQAAAFLRSTLAPGHDIAGASPIGLPLLAEKGGLCPNDTSYMVRVVWERPGIKH